MQIFVSVPVHARGPKTHTTKPVNLWGKKPSKSKSNDFGVKPRCRHESLFTSVRGPRPDLFFVFSVVLSDLDGFWGLTVAIFWLFAGLLWTSLPRLAFEHLGSPEHVITKFINTVNLPMRKLRFFKALFASLVTFSDVKTFNQ